MGRGEGCGRNVRRWSVNVEFPSGREPGPLLALQVADERVLEQLWRRRVAGLRESFPRPHPSMRGGTDVPVQIKLTPLLL